MCLAALLTAYRNLQTEITSRIHSKAFEPGHSVPAIRIHYTFRAVPYRAYWSFRALSYGLTDVCKLVSGENCLVVKPTAQRDPLIIILLLRKDCLHL
ncbi:predicted protein [Sclerotinia sclerotiorum 1980 UF-70]|uniref:Uncharacterized protein n=1 Tax=Sclerotinia sclerotiorum (strain ATCC 18683 / 1980 / Ss-1) TaxID=665079 RepID=A7EPW6_SCLS1|nr:predicted protein [Sclerotinia sclerotiorum 1980 UF-70]EDO04882.1 predicted protein [Sclerotinia sclerotiorum 1980 UF-70]